MSFPGFPFPHFLSTVSLFAALLLSAVLLAGCEGEDITGPFPEPVLWDVNLYGSTGSDQAWSVVQRPEGFLLAGTAARGDGDFDGLDVTGDAGILAWLDNSGSIVDVLSLNGEGNDAIISATVRDDGGVIAAGVTHSADEPFNASGTGDVFIVSLDSNREIEWLRTYGGSGFDFPVELLVSQDEKIMVTGHSSSNDGELGDTESSGDHVFLMQADMNGEPEWIFTAGGNGSERPAGLHQAQNGEWLLTGSTTSNEGFFGEIQRGDRTMFVTRLTTGGSAISVQGFGGSGEDFLSASFLTANEELLLAGSTQSNDGDFENLNPAATSASLLRVRNDGTIAQANVIGGEGDDAASVVIELPGERILFAGRTTSADWIDESDHEGFSDLGFVVELGFDGEIRDSRMFGGSGEDVIVDGLIAGSSVMAFTGTTNSTDGDLEDAPGIRNMMLIFGNF